MRLPFQARARQATLAGANTFTTGGNGAIGVYASQGGAISASGATTVSTSGGTSPATGLGAYGVNADGAGSTVSLAATTVKTTGAGAFGLLASDAAGSGGAGSITISGPLNVTTTNPGATAIGLQGAGASIVATGGGTIASAGGAIAFLGGTNQTATFNNFTIANQTGNLIFADPSTATINFNSTTANAGIEHPLERDGRQLRHAERVGVRLDRRDRHRFQVDVDGQSDERLDLDHDRLVDRFDSHGDEQRGRLRSTERPWRVQDPDDRQLFRDLAHPS